MWFEDHSIIADVVDSYFVGLVYIDRHSHIQKSYCLIICVVYFESYVFCVFASIVVLSFIRSALVLCMYVDVWMCDCFVCVIHVWIICSVYQYSYIVCIYICIIFIIWFILFIFIILQIRMKVCCYVCWFGLTCVCFFFHFLMDSKWFMQIFVCVFSRISTCMIAAQIAILELV